MKELGFSVIQKLLATW